MKYRVNFNNKEHHYEVGEDCLVSEITKKFPITWIEKDFYIICNGKIQVPSTAIKDECLYHVVPRLIGGKGGFGSMLRAIGAQIEKTTNREACRDLSGRRMRDVNNEKKLKDWLGKSKDREQEKEQKRKERLERRKAVPLHKFVDATYETQKSQVIGNLDDALQQGLKKTNGSSSSAPKRPMTSTTSSSKKAKVEWLGVDLDDLPSDSDESGSDDSDAAAQPGSSNSAASSSSESNEPISAECENNIDLPLCSSPEEKVVDNEANHHAGTPLKLTDGADNQQSEKIASTDQKACSDKQLNPEEIDLNKYSSASDLETLGLDVLKTALISRGLKCGGTLQERAQRLFSVKGLAPNEIDPSLKSKSLKGKNVKGK